ncbi:MAG: BREX-1 system adenine-specific DNA-methyltransferase PglX [Saccharofermentanales bacterium]
MNKTAIKNFAIWARNKLIADITYKAGLLGISEKGIKSPLPQSTQTVQFFDIGTKEPSSISGIEIQQRKKLVEEIERKAKQSDYATAYKNVIEEVSYTWFNRLIAIRFMEVNDYLPTRIRVLSSDSSGKTEPDLVTHAMEANLDYSAYEKDRIIQLKNENKLDELFRLLFIKQCNALNANLPELFEKTSDYTEILLNVSFTDKDGIVYHLINDISEDDFNVSKEGQVEIIGWLYQYYNTEPKDETFALLKKNVKITKERIPAATQLFTPDWIVRYMVENSLGRLWLEGHPNDELKAIWKYFMDEAEQEDDVQNELDKIREEYKAIKPEDIKVIDPAMGSGHILVYAFDVLMQIYESHGYSQRDAAKNIIEKNLYGLDIDNRAYQLAYFAVMMKARQYNRRILNGETICHLYAIQESNDIDRNQLKYFGSGLSEMEKNTASLQLQGLLDTFTDAKEYGSILKVENYNWELLHRYTDSIDANGQMSLDSIGVEFTRNQIRLIVEIGKIISNKYDVVITNPPYMGSNGMGGKLSEHVKEYYPDSKSDLFAVFIQKGLVMTKHCGYSCMVTMQSWMFLSSFEKLRIGLVNSKTISTLMHMENMVMGIAFGTAVSNFRNCNIKGYRGTYNHVSIKNIGEDELPKEFPIKKNRFAQISSENFSKIPGTPIAYWVSDEFALNYKEKPMGKYSEVITGMTIGDNNKYLRLWYEVSWETIAIGKSSMNEINISTTKWIPYSKGGTRRCWYGNYDYVVNWSQKSNFNRSKTTLQHLYLKEALTWPFITTGRFCARILPKGFLWDVAGSPCFFDNIKTEYYALGALCSNTVDYILKVVNPTINVQAKDIAQLPLIFGQQSMTDNVVERVKDNISLSKADWDSFETSWDFLVHPLAKRSGLISSLFEEWESECEERFNLLKSNEESINQCFINIYGLEQELDSAVEERDITIAKADLKRDIETLISYAVGCMFGRYSVDTKGLCYAGGDWDKTKYSTFIPDKDNIIPITDEEYFKDDIVGLFISFVKTVYGESNLDENLDYIANVLGKKGYSSREAIRNYFIKDFFNDHCKVYQKRPIYWLFDSGKQNGFKALVYMHSYDENSIGNLRIDYLHRMQRIYENEIARMQDTIDNSKDARELATATKRKEKLIKQLQETKEYDEKIAHLALARTSIDLDDGVKVNYEKVQTDRDGKKLEVLAKI